jgi:hypothetical protein
MFIRRLGLGDKMPILQAFNKRTKSWVKYHFVKGKGFRVLDVKQNKSKTAFKGIKIRGQKK